MSSPPVHPHFKQQARSYANLEAACKIGAKKTGYNSATTRERVKTIFSQRFGHSAREWQIDVTEAILLGLNSIVIAGTGAGKTILFMMPLMLSREKKAIIISPLKILQADQVRNAFLTVQCAFNNVYARLRGFRRSISQLWQSMVTHGTLF